MKSTWQKLGFLNNTPYPPFFFGDFKPTLAEYPIYPYFCAMPTNTFVKRKTREPSKAEVVEDSTEITTSTQSESVQEAFPVFLKSGSRTPKNVTRKDIRELLDADLDRSIGGVRRMDALIARLVTEAIRGNMRAMELTLAYLYGKPGQQQTAPDTGPFVLELSEPTTDEANSEADAGV